jgi:hypothetical protein
VIAQVEGEFRARGYGVTLSKNAINRYVALCMLGTFPLVRGYEGMMPKHAFELLVLAMELFVQISNVNSIDAKRLTLMMAVNTCCGAASAECRAKHSLYDRVMKSTIVLLNADVSPAVEERHVRWTTYANLNAWFDNFRAFLIKFDFPGVGDNGEPTFTEAQLHRIMNIYKTEISLDASNTRAGGRPAVSFHDPHLPLTSRSKAKSLLACTGIFDSSSAGECVPPHQLPMSVTAKEREQIQFKFLTLTLDTPGRFSCAEERIWPCTIAMNEKGVMTDDEFKKYIDNSINIQSQNDYSTT